MKTKAPKIGAADGPTTAEAVKHLSKIRDATTQKDPSSLEFDEDDSFEFSNLNMDLIEDREISLIYRFFQICLAISAALDFAAAMAHHLDDGDETEIETASAKPFWRRRVQVVEEEDTFFEPLIEFLVAHGTIFGFIFSAFWFLNSFIEANRRRVKALRENDKKKLSSSKGDAVGNKENKIRADATSDHKQNSQLVYFSTVLFQLAMLPAGFYVFLFSKILQIRDEDAVVEVVKHIGEGDDEPDLYESYSIHANLCLVFAVVKYVLIRISGLLHLRMSRRLEHTGKRLAKTLAFRAVRNPFRFHRRVRKALRALRWIKYLAPLIGTGNKLKGNVAALLKNLKQRREAALARRVREKLWDELTEEELREYCARLIQKTYRAHQRRKTLAALRLFQDSTEQIAARKLQKHFRALLKRTRNQLKAKQVELLRLREKEKEAQKENTALDEEERFRMYELQDELQRKTSEFLNKKLLMRPNTTFAVSWRLLFVFAVLVEITQLALNPVIAKHKDSDGNSLQMVTFLEDSLIPSPVSELPECSLPAPKKGLVGLLYKLFSKKRPTGSAVLLPWYCESEIYSNFQVVYAWLVRESLESFFDVLGLVCFFDVFITFFIGEYDPVTGQLGPAPFFQRWILPGICLQLLVNPKMDTIADIVTFVGSGLIRQGPFRVLRWTVAFFFPAFLVAKHYLKKYWLRLAAKENQNARKIT